MAVNEKDLSILARIEEKLNKSKVLNGGFDALLVTVDNMKEKQDEMSTEVKDIKNNLIDPENGVYVRLKTMETSLEHMQERHTDHIKDDEVALAGIKEEIKSSFAAVEKKAIPDQEVRETVEITKRLKAISGDTTALDELKKTLDVSKQMRLLFWGMIGTLATTVVKFIWDLLVHK